MASSNAYQDRLKKATDLATRATQTEASLSSLSPLASPLPTLHKAFPLYISAAEQYSLILSTQTLSDDARNSIKKKWRLVLERAEKVKKRIEDLGGHVGKVGAGDEAEEEAIRVRGGLMNGIKLDLWSAPSSSAFKGSRVVENQPELAKEQEEMDPEWADVDDAAWGQGLTEERWLVRQGPGADCSVVAGLGACLDHNRRFGTRLAQSAILPTAPGGTPSRSENGRHVVKLLLNGCWRSVLIDSLLPRSRSTRLPLHATTRPAVSPRDPLISPIGPAWIPLLLKGYFKAHGGYSLRGSNPSPDVRTLTGWIPERIGLRDGFQREKEWRRVKDAWDRGNVVVTLGTGSRESSGEGLVPYHAYAVLDMDEDANGERLLRVYDPGIMRQHAEEADLGDRLGSLDINGQGMTGSGMFTRTWDAICAEFETLNLNWDPALMPTTATRHWSWGKPVDGESGPISSLRYRLAVTSKSLQPKSEIWVLLSQHVVNKDRALDDIALHVHEDSTTGSSGCASRTTVSTLERIASSSPYSNAVHVLYRHVVRKASTSLTIMPLRDRGLYRTDFTLQAFAPDHLSIDLERISTTLPFSTTIKGNLTGRNAGGHAGLPSWIDNPQFKLTVAASQGSRRVAADKLRVMLQGDTDMAWNVKVLWGKGELVSEWDDEGSLADSGAYAYGMALADVHNVQPGTYTLPVSAFEARQHGQFTLSVESTLPVSLVTIPAEGAGMYSRTLSGTWDENTSGGRPSGGSFHLNPKIEATLPRDCTVMARAILPSKPAMPIPLNLTLFKRNTASVLGEQVATSGPYSDAVCGVSVPRTKVTKGVYVFVVSPWERGMGLHEKWEVRIWADGPLELERVS